METTFTYKKQKDTSIDYEHYLVFRNGIEIGYIIDNLLIFGDNFDKIHSNNSYRWTFSNRSRYTLHSDTKKDLIKLIETEYSK